MQRINCVCLADNLFVFLRLMRLCLFSSSALLLF